MVRDTTLLGPPVRVRAEPGPVRVGLPGRNKPTHHGGSGALYPELRVTHTDTGPGVVAVRLMTAYVGEFSVAGGPWLPVLGEAEVAGPPSRLEVLAGGNALVADLVRSTSPSLRCRAARLAAADPTLARMSTLKVLFIGGSGIISSACSRARRRARARADRPQPRAQRPAPAPARGARAARRRPRPGVGAAALGDREFDAVVDWVAFTPEHVRTRHRAVPRAGPGSTCSSARPRPTRRRRRGCRSPSRRRCATRSGSTPGTRSPARSCSSRPTARSGFPVTVVRPSHTYDRTLVPVRRRLDGRRPDARGQAGRRARRRHLAVDADPPRATSPARFVPLLGDPRTLGEAFHITSDEALTWDQIAHALAAAPRGSSRGSCTCPPTPSPPPTPSGAPGCSATRRTRWSSTTPRSSALVAGLRRDDAVRAGRPRDRRLARRGPVPPAGRRPPGRRDGPAGRGLPPAPVLISRSGFSPRARRVTTAPGRRVRGAGTRQPAGGDVAGSRCRCLAGRSPSFAPSDSESLNTLSPLRASLSCSLRAPFFSFCSSRHRLCLPSVRSRAGRSADARRTVGGVRTSVRA